MRLSRSSLRCAKFLSGLTISKMREEFEQLQAQLDKAQKDSKRIDFLADKNQFVANVIMPREIVERNLSSLRDAIDEAMMIEEMK